MLGTLLKCFMKQEPVKDIVIKGCPPYHQGEIILKDPEFTDLEKAIIQTIYDDRWERILPKKWSLRYQDKYQDKVTGSSMLVCPIRIGEYSVNVGGVTVDPRIGKIIFDYMLEKTNREIREMEIANTKTLRAKYLGETE